MPEAARLERRRINENLIGLRPCPPTAPFQSLALLLMIATGVVLAASAPVFAQDKSHVGHAHGRGDDGVVPTMPGQDAFGAIQEIVRLLEADPDTDWRRSTWLPWGAPHRYARGYIHGDCGRAPDRQRVADRRNR